MGLAFHCCVFYFIVIFSRFRRNVNNISLCLVLSAEVLSINGSPEIRHFRWQEFGNGILFGRFLVGSDLDLFLLDFY